MSQGPCASKPEPMCWRLLRRLLRDVSVVDSLKGVAMTYLDHAASTPMRASALEAMMPYLTEQFANPNGSHRFARLARRAIDEARDQIGELVGVSPGQIIFTGGGTESNNIAIAGTTRSARIASAGIAVSSAAEHHAVLHPVERGEHRVVAVDDAGAIDLDRLDGVLAELDATARIVVSVMAVNNEVGTVTDLAAVADIVRNRAPQALLHTDAVQGAAWLDLRPVGAMVDSMSISGHKIGGPKGVGVLTLPSGHSVEPIAVGGGQERDMRPGTHNVAGIVGMAVALAETDRDRASDAQRVARLRDRLVDTIADSVPDTIETVPRDRKVAGSAHLCFPDVENEALLFLLDQEEVYASAASACASGAMEPSHVLAAMGVPTETARGALRLTLGHTTTDDDVDRGATAVIDAVQRLRERSRR